MTVDPIFLMKHRERLEAKRRRLAQIESRSNSESAAMAAFPMGPGCGNASSRKSHYRSMNASVDRAVESVRLRREIATECAFLDAYEAGKVDKQGRRVPPSGDKLRGLVATAEKILATGMIKGRPLLPEEVEPLKETLRHYKGLLRKEERADAAKPSKANAPESDVYEAYL